MFTSTQLVRASFRMRVFKNLSKIELHLLKESNRSEVLSNSEVFVTLAHKENLIVAKMTKKAPGIKNVTEKSGFIVFERKNRPSTSNTLKQLKFSILQVYYNRESSSEPSTAD